MSQYLMSVYYVEGEEAPSEGVIKQMYADVDALNTRMQEEGAWVFAGGLQTPDIATVVSSRNGEVLTTDGPFPEAKEQIGGFWVIDAANLDEALEWAREATIACRGPVEVRPFQDEPES